MWDAAGEFLLKLFGNKWFWIVVVILGIVFAIYKYGKAHGDAPKDIRYPQGGNGLPQGWNATALIERFHDAFDGLFTSPSTKGAIYAELLALPTDDMLVAVYNGFNQRYYTKDDGTFTQWVRDEVIPPFGDRTLLLSRLQRLNLP